MPLNELTQLQLIIENVYMFWFSAKMTRLKQAKEEAETEVSEHKTSTEQGFQRKLEAVTLIN